MKTSKLLTMTCALFAALMLFSCGKTSSTDQTTATGQSVATLQYFSKFYATSVSDGFSGGYKKTYLAPPQTGFSPIAIRGAAQRYFAVTEMQLNQNNTYKIVYYEYVLSGNSYLPDNSSRREIIGNWRVSDTFIVLDSFGRALPTNYAGVDMITIIADKDILTPGITGLSHQLAMLTIQSQTP